MSKFENIIASISKNIETLHESLGIDRGHGHRDTTNLVSGGESIDGSVKATKVSNEYSRDIVYSITKDDKQVALVKYYGDYFILTDPTKTPKLFSMYGEPVDDSHLELHGKKFRTIEQILSEFTTSELSK